jgi:aspartate aminotransferase
VPGFVEAVRGYYGDLGIKLDSGDILATTGGSEALSIALACILDEGDEI